MPFLNPGSGCEGIERSAGILRQHRRAPGQDEPCNGKHRVGGFCIGAGDTLRDGGGFGAEGGDVALTCKGFASTIVIIAFEERQNGLWQGKHFGRVGEVADREIALSADHLAKHRSFARDLRPGDQRAAER
jgi:hypothetical protein